MPTGSNWMTATIETPLVVSYGYMFVGAAAATVAGAAARLTRRRRGTHGSEEALIGHTTRPIRRRIAARAAGSVLVLSLSAMALVTTASPAQAGDGSWSGQTSGHADIGSTHGG